MGRISILACLTTNFRPIRFPFSVNFFSRPCGLLPSVSEFGSKEIDLETAVKMSSPGTSTAKFHSLLLLLLLLLLLPLLLLSLQLLLLLLSVIKLQSNLTLWKRLLNHK